MTKDLQQRKAELEAELARVNQEIGAAELTPFKERGSYWYPDINCVFGDVDATRSSTTESQIRNNTKNIFMFKTKEQCERFNEKLLDLARREAKILYGEVEKPEPTLAYSLEEDGDTGDWFILMFDRGQLYDIKALRDYCNQVLDYLENKEVRR